MKPANPNYVDTPRGVRIDLKCIYVYPDGHANFIYADGRDKPLADAYQLFQHLAGDVLRPAVRRAQANARREERELAAALKAHAKKTAS